MTRRLIAVGVLTAVTALAVPTLPAAAVGSAKSVPHHLTRVLVTAVPPRCC
jgi:hypothetical protein